MKLPKTMIDRACKAYWAEAGTFVSTEERIHAALEAALSDAWTVAVPSGAKPKAIEVPESLYGKLLVVVVLDD